MKITTLLIEPAIENLEKELAELVIKVPQGKNLFNSNQKLLDKVCALLSDVAALKKEISNSSSLNSGVIPDHIYKELRRLKSQTHTAGRTFLKIKSNEVRFGKMADRRSDVSTVAA